MKRHIKTIIITGAVVVAGFASGAFAQSQAELQAQYHNLLLQLLEKLQMQLANQQGQVSGGADFQLPVGEVCALRYQGDTAIISVQQELQNQGYAISKVDGKIGPETRAAVKAFQANTKAEKIDGLIGAETRRLLSEHSVACVGDNGVSVNPNLQSIALVGEVCHLDYTGANDVAAIQQELQNQGYAISKVDGKIGPETRAAVKVFQADHNQGQTGILDQDLRIALARAAVVCATTTGGTVINPEPLPTVPVTEPEPQEPQEETPPSQEDTQLSVQATTRSATVRSTAGVPDDTAIFTYQLQLKPSSVIYIPTNPDDAFSIEVMNSAGLPVANKGIASLSTSAQKLVREDGSSYYLVKSGDTMSLRTSVQPGAGDYYAELARINYTSDNAFTVQNPAMINYGFDANSWRTETVTLLN